MDPALWEELARIGNRGAAVEAIVRLDRPNAEIPGLRLVARFGQIATCRIAVERIPQVYNDPRVLSLKASRLVGPERAPLCHGKPIVGLTPTRTDRCGPANRRLTGQGVVVGVIDTGCDVDHPSFKWPDGSSRLLALWDQRDREAGLELAPYGYGIRFGRADINRALRSGRPYEVLGYHPADADRDGMGAHGTHVMDISGIGAAGADLVFAHLANRRGNALAGDDLTSLGDSCRLLEAIDWVSRTAGQRPCVINISQGRHGGPHDGSTLVELAVSQWLQATPGRFVVFSAGNYASSRTHSSGNVTPGLARTLTFTTDPADLTPNEIELWYSGEDELFLGLETPSGHRTPLVPLGSRAEVHEQGRVVGRIYHLRDRNNGEHMVDLFLDPSAPAGHWRLTLHPVRIRNGRFDAWIERDEACKPCQARFVDSDVDPFCTLGTLANSHGPQLIVGAYDAHTPGRPVADFSSWGPTRDGRLKPDLLAPGVDVLAARSAPRGSMRSPGELVRRSGTSMAAPAVTSAVALCLGAFGRRLDADELRDLILRNTRRPTAPDEIPARLGHGYLDLARLTDDVLTQIRPGACRVGVRETMWPRRDPKEPSMARATDPTDVQEFDPDRLYRELTYSQGSPPARLDAMFVPLARPGERPSEPPQGGDVLVRVALGEPGRGHVAILSDGHLTPHTGLGPVRAERGGSGYYAAVTDGPRCHGRTDPVWRRVLDTAGRLPPGQLLLRPRAQSGLEPPTTEQAGDPLTAPLSTDDWALVETWQSAGRIGLGDQLTGDPDRNALLIAGSLFCSRRIGTPGQPTDDPLLCVDRDVTGADPRVVELARHVQAHGPIVNWVSVPAARRRVFVMEQLINRGFPVNGAAGIVGNLHAESAVLPNRIESSRPASPMRARNFAGAWTDFSATDVMNRNITTQQGPAAAGIGLAQWTTAPRRAGLFLHAFAGRPPGARILFDLEAQVDYLDAELRGLPGVRRILTNPAVTLNDASDEFFYNVERPGSIIVNGVVLPRNHPTVQARFRERRRQGRIALNDYRRAHPPGDSAESTPTERDSRSAPPRRGSTRAEALAAVEAFRGRTAASPWRLDRSQVARRLAELVRDPSKVDQDALNLCGPAAFLPLWLQRDPLAVVRFAAELYDSGRASIGGDYVVEPGDGSLLGQDYTALAAAAGPGFCPPADWMILCSLRDSENVFFDFEGRPDEDVSSATTSGEVAGWLRATSLYRDVSDEGNFFFTKGTDHLLNLTPSANQDVVLLINAHILDQADVIRGGKKSSDFILSAFPNHFIILTARVQPVPGDRLQMTYWTWGLPVTTATFIRDTVDANYYGAVIARR
ncbi:phage tail tip lysozyme [Streptomyces melanosporofaciens]|uniref:Subtilase family protein n=1 Tax=Streptomyces melanosporofaciens TaxID=67327 RepID=A0A1H4X8J3_STRMJ|nr:phage tail tip lysozyme [Streptomyces melanosporofaciens]SED01976.1 Subtilase family protein [Streptomyces melanosporofaciens]